MKTSSMAERLLTSVGFREAALALSGVLAWAVFGGSVPALAQHPDGFSKTQGTYILVPRDGQ